MKLFSDTVDSATLASAWKGINTRRARAQRLRRAWIATPIVAVLALVLLLVARRSTHDPLSQTRHVIALANGAPLPSTWSAASAQVIAFDDGSRLELGEHALVRMRTTGAQREASRVDLLLEGGTATFDINPTPPGGPRAWVIDAGTTRVRVLGTRFTVAKEGDHVHVSVARGKVRVESARIQGGMRDLLPGDEIDVGAVAASDKPHVPDVVEAPVMAVEDLADAPPASAPPTVHARPSGQPQAPPSPNAGALEGPAESAPPALAPADVTPDRMTQADGARRAGRPREAVAILTSVVEAKEPRSPLAAFTIGKIHAEELGEQAAAASWFERAIRLGLPIGLDEDAHARVVECHARAGRFDDAARAASVYEAKFAGGRHLARVRRWKKE